MASPSIPASSFVTPLVTEYMDGRRFRVWIEFDFVSREQGTVIRVPTGFITDFASTPRFFHRVFPPHGLYGPAAVIHDYLYFTGLLPRHRADQMFYEGMTVLGVGLITRYSMFWAVRLFGWRPYGRYRRRDRKRPVPPAGSALGTTSRPRP